MSEVQLKNLSKRHDAIMEWLLANPERSLLECARTFVVTQAWLSCIIHSDIFQARYQKMLGEYQDGRIMPLRDKLIGVVNKAIDNVAQAVETSADGEFNLDVADRLLNRLGYGTKVAQAPGGLTINNVQMVSAATPEEIAAARMRFRQSQQELPVIEVEATAQPRESVPLVCVPVIEPPKVANGH